MDGTKPELSAQALLVLVQIMEREVAALAARQEAADEDDPELADVEEELLVVSNVREEVRRVYAAAAADADNLPPLASLVKD